MRGTTTSTVTSAVVLQRIDRWRFAVLYVVALVLMLVVASRAAQRFEPDAVIPLALLSVGALAILARPSLGVHLAVFFSLAGDGRTAWWYPFNKNLSSYESILYVADAVKVNPLEIVLAITLVSWLLRWTGDPTKMFVRGPLLAPLTAFGVFVLIGLFTGLWRGGDVTIGLWEARPLLYLPLLYVLVTNLFDSAASYLRLVWVAMTALVCQSLVAIAWYLDQAPDVRVGLESLTEHAASVHLNAFFVFALAMWLLPRCSPWGRLAVVPMAIPIVAAYMLSQRRAAFIGLVLGIVLFAAFLYVFGRRVFWWFVPIVGVTAIGYLMAFWSVEGGLGFPAQAIKSVVAPDSLGARNVSSNDYRELEALNVWFTIRTNPLRGIGFGQPFYRIHALPDISSFGFWEYMPHHSFLWIWLKTGFFGFVSMLFLLIRTIQYGVRSALSAPAGDHRAIAVTAVLYVVMYTVFSYVDIAWDTRSMVFLAVAMAICSDTIAPQRRVAVRDERVLHPSR